MTIDLMRHFATSTVLRAATNESLNLIDIVHFSSADACIMVVDCNPMLANIL